MANDSLAAGARSATFPPPKISQEKWDKIWADEKQPTKTKKEKE